MGIFGPSRDERLAAAARALHPYGFTMDWRYAQGLRQYEPFAEMHAPESYVTACFGTIEGARVEAYEYEYTVHRTIQSGGIGSDGMVHTMDVTDHETALAVVVHHPWIRGGASFVADLAAWGTLGTVINAILWVPPFTIAKIVMALAEMKNPDREVGDAEFDRRYKVHAPSEEAARAAIPPTLREVCNHIDFRGSVELRPGVLIYSPYPARLDEQTAVQALGVATAFLGAFAPKGAHPMR
jgi:hypothetical protein